LVDVGFEHVDTGEEARASRRSVPDDGEIHHVVNDLRALLA
jgi:hypothetical protein